MSEFRDEDLPEPGEGRRDPAQRLARQLEVHFEVEFYHWITNRAVADLVEREVLRMESRDLTGGGVIHILWHRRNRYYRRAASEQEEAD